MNEPVVPVPPSRSGEPDELYIGYAPPMPPRTARVVKRVATAIAASSIVAAAGLAIGHVTLDGGNFEFGHPRTIAGVIVEHPYPTLRTAGETPGAPDTSSLLVAPGKHGADALVRGLDGQRVTFSATRIQRGEHTMFEIDPSSVTPATPSSASPHAVAPATLTATAASAPVTLRGEIVDSKCFLGVMVPGEGVTHKACASLCLRGGIPPALLVRDRAGRSALLLLVTMSDEPIGAAAIALAGEPVEMTGITTRRGDWWLLRTDPATWRPLADARR
jgi:hypothetical protein